MSTRIPFLDDLREELLAHAPDVIVFGAVAPPRRRRRGPVAAVAVFALVVVVGGLAVWLTAGREAPDPLTGPFVIDWDLRAIFPAPDDPTDVVAAVEALPGVVEVQYFPDASVPFPAPPLPSDDAGERPPETTPDGSTVLPDGPPVVPIAALLVRIDDPDRAADTAVALWGIDGMWRVLYSDRIAARFADEYFVRATEGAAVVHTRPLVLQPAPGPEPRFDTSDLGREVVLEPAAAGDDVAGWLDERLRMWKARAEGGVVSPELDERRPVLHLGRDPERSRRLVLYPVREFPSAGDGYCIEVAEGSSTGGSCGDFADPRFGFALVASDGYTVARVPVDAAVVTFAGEREGRLWQRPVAGWAMFPSVLSGADTYPGVVEAYDADGALLGRWGDDPPR